MSTTPLLIVVLAGGYGSRLEKDLLSFGSKEEREKLLGVNKALLPLTLMNSTLLDSWFDHELVPLLRCVEEEKKWRGDKGREGEGEEDGGEIVDFEGKRKSRREALFSDPTHRTLIATNALHFPSFSQWAASHSFPLSLLYSDGTHCNEERKGALGTLSLSLDYSSSLSPIQNDTRLVVIPSDTQLRSDYMVIRSMLSLLDSHIAQPRSSSSSSSSEIFGVILGYREREEVLSKRGVAEIEGDFVLRFLEKPDPSQTKSRIGVPAVYVFRDAIRTQSLLKEFLERFSSLPLEERDAPGKFISWLINEEKMRFLIHIIPQRDDLGSLQDYRVASSCALGIAFPRIGLMGNPSDSCEGKALALSLANYAAYVRLSPSPSSSKRISFVAHPVHDQVQFDGGLSALPSLFNGALRLMKAGVVAFRDYWLRREVSLETLNPIGFEVSYETSIPRQVGLSGSSALLTALFRALERWYGVRVDAYEGPLLLLYTELKLLGIAAVCLHTHTLTLFLFFHGFSFEFVSSFL